MKKIFKYVSAAFVGGFIVSAAIASQENCGFFYKHSGRRLTINAEMEKQYPGLEKACQFMAANEGEKPISYPEAGKMIAAESDFRRFYPMLCFCSDAWSGKINVPVDSTEFCSEFCYGIKVLRGGNVEKSCKVLGAGLAARVLTWGFPKETIRSMLPNNLAVTADCAAYECVVDLLTCGLVSDLEYQIDCWIKEGQERLEQVLPFCREIRSFILKFVASEHVDKSRILKEMPYVQLANVTSLTLENFTLTEGAALEIARLFALRKVQNGVFKEVYFTTDKACEGFCKGAHESQMTKFYFNSRHLPEKQLKCVVCFLPMEAEEIGIDLGSGDKEKDVRRICLCLYNNQQLTSADFTVASVSDKLEYERGVAMAVAQHPRLARLVLADRDDDLSFALCRTVIASENKIDEAAKLIRSTDERDARYEELLAGVQHVTRIDDCSVIGEEPKSSFEVRLKLGDTQLAREIFDGLPEDRKETKAVSRKFSGSGLIQIGAPVPQEEEVSSPVVSDQPIVKGSQSENASNSVIPAQEESEN